MTIVPGIGEPKTLSRNQFHDGRLCCCDLDSAFKRILPYQRLSFAIMIARVYFRPFAIIHPPLVNKSSWQLLNKAFA